MTFASTTRRHLLQSAAGAAGLAVLNPWSQGRAGSPRHGGTLTVLIDPGAAGPDDDRAFGWIVGVDFGKGE